MNVLLDTCAILLVSLNDPSVTAHTHQILEQAEAVFVSPISGAELACLEEKGRIELPKHWRVWLQDAIERNGWNVIPITLEIVEEGWLLPGTFHADRADLILTATARKEDLVLMTTDRKIRDYLNVKTDW